MGKSTRGARGPAAGGSELIAPMGSQGVAPRRFTQETLEGDLLTEGVAAAGRGLPRPRGRRRALSLATLAVAALLPAPAAGQPEGGWETYAEEKNARFERRDVPGSGYPELRATLEVPQASAAVAESLWAACSDATSTKDLKKKLLRSSPGEVVVYQQVLLSAASDRDYTLRIWRSPPASDGTVVLRYEIANELGPPPDARFVRLEAVYGFWTIAPLAGGGSRISCLSYSDAGGSVPAALVRGPQRERFASEFWRFIERLPPPTSPSPGGKPAEARGEVAPR